MFTTVCHNWGGCNDVYTLNDSYDKLKFRWRMVQAEVLCLHDMKCPACHAKGPPIKWHKSIFVLAALIPWIAAARTAYALIISNLSMPPLKLTHIFVLSLGQQYFYLRHIDRRQSVIDSDIQNILSGNIVLNHTKS